MTIMQVTKKIIVNIDKDQLNNLNVNFDYRLNVDGKFFLKKLLIVLIKKIIGIQIIKN